MYIGPWKVVHVEHKTWLGLKIVASRAEAVIFMNFEDYRRAANDKLSRTLATKQAAAVSVQGCTEVCKETTRVWVAMAKETPVVKRRQQDKWSVEKTPYETMQEQVKRRKTAHIGNESIEGNGSSRNNTKKCGIPRPPQGKWMAKVRREMCTVDTDSDEGGCDSSELEAEQEKALDTLLTDSAPDGTISVDKSHWKTWCKACQQLNMRPWRIKRKKSASAKRRERRKLAYVVWTIYDNMKPRSKDDTAPKPSSAYQVYLGAKRVHKRANYDMEDGSVVVQAMKAITKQFIQKHGHAPLVTRRREPLERAWLEVWLSYDGIMSEGTKIGSLQVSRKSKAWKSWRCLQATAAQTGVRRSEVSTKSQKVGFTKLQFSRASLVYKIKGELYADPSPEQLRTMDEKDAVILKPRTSKADSEGKFWCDKPIYLP